MLPIVTLLGLSLPWLFTAGLVIEQIFNYPGTGLLFFTSAQSQDYPVELGITVVIAVTTVRRQPAGRHRLCRARPAHQVQLGGPA